MATQITFHKDSKKYVSAEVAWYYRIIPSAAAGDSIELFIDESKLSKDISNELEIVLGKKVSLIPADPASIEKALTGFYIKETGKNTASAENTKPNISVSGKDFVTALIQEAKTLKSSDIHIETYEQKCRIRFRMDGKLVERTRLSKQDYPALINKIKIMAGLDISERRLPQDGRIFFSRDEFKFDIRVSVLPTLYGEKIVLRILGTSATDIDLGSLGFSVADLVRYKESIRKPNGIILISGPTGSGKTTTLYATLKLLNKETDNILTVEDPIEYTLEGINQVQVKDEIGLTFSRALRTFLRQDPDVIMVGEIRDTETANLAIRAALTGHLVLSTIHTNSAWGTISRLADMNIPPFLLASTLNATLAQRLVRLLCEHCKEKAVVSSNIFPQNFKKQHLVREHYIAKGCKECFFTGYKGRKAIYEVIPIDGEVSEFIISGSREVSEYFKSLGVKTLQESAIELLREGQTSVEEIYSLLLNEQY